MPEKAVIELYSDPNVAWKDFFTPIFDDTLLSHYRRTAQFAYDDHLIRVQIPAEELLQPKFVAQALKELKLEHFWSQTPIALRTPALASKLN